MHTNIEQVAIELVEANAKRYNAVNQREVERHQGSVDRLLDRLEQVVLEEREETRKAQEQREEMDARRNESDEEHAEDPVFFKFPRVWGL